MKIVKTCILLLVFILSLYLVVQASPYNDKTILSSKFAKNLLNSKKGDKVKKVRKYLSTFGILNEKTLSLTVKTRPGLQHNVKLVRDSFKSGSYYELSNTRWPITNLTWAVELTVPSYFTYPINNAFKTWKNAAPFEFVQVENITLANIKIYYTDRDSEWGNVMFKGKGKGSLACSFLPPLGSLHFRAGMPWAILLRRGEVGKFDIETIALHELGHILGLGHSEIPAAVMYLNTARGAIKRNLHEDDIAGIRALYNFP